MSKVLRVFTTYLSKVRTPTLLYSCLLYIATFICTLPAIGAKWKEFQIFLIVALGGLFGFIVFFRRDFDLLFIRIQDQNAVRVGVVFMLISFLGCVLLYLNLWV